MSWTLDHFGITDIITTGCQGWRIYNLLALIFYFYLYNILYYNIDKTGTYALDY